MSPETPLPTPTAPSAERPSPTSQSPEEENRCGHNADCGDAQEREMRGRVEIALRNAGSGPPDSWVLAYLMKLPRGDDDLRGRTVSSVHDLAHLAQVYRDPRVETLRIVYTKGDESVALWHSVVNNPDSTRTKSAPTKTQGPRAAGGGFRIQLRGDCVAVQRNARPQKNVPANVPMAGENHRKPGHARGNDCRNPLINLWIL